jgi:peptidoglycan/xylan/chitin deacetylase (PgdA/CDA1 family)
MATNTLHLVVRVSAGLATVALIASPAVSRGSADAFVLETSGRTPAPTEAGQQTRTLRAPCSLRLPRHLPGRTRRVPILMYHRVDVVTPSTPEITRRLTVDPAVFAHQMRWLRRHGYHTIAQRQLFDALMCGRALPRKPILITFDDGYRDILTKASPVLARLGMRATAYVISGRISKPTFLRWRQLPRLEACGIEIGSHTVSHRALTTLSDSQARTELVRSRRVLEQRLGHRVPWLAYPIGDYDARIEGLARRAGYVLAVTTEAGTSQFARRPLALHRLRILDSTGVRGLATMLGSTGANRSRSASP